MQITISIKGELVRKGLADTGAEIPKVSRQQIRVVMERIKRKMQAYPPEPEGQSTSSSHATLGTVYRTAKGRYHRTGNLGSHWAIDPTPSGYRIENTAVDPRGKAYGRYVVGDAYGQGQAWMHEGRWQLLRDVVEEETENLPTEVRDLIILVARRHNL